MTGQQIRDSLKSRKIKIVDIARLLHVSPVTVSLVIDKKSTSARISKAIAEAINVPLDQLHSREAA